jgi:hypothetical protein
MRGLTMYVAISKFLRIIFRVNRIRRLNPSANIELIYFVFIFFILDLAGAHAQKTGPHDIPTEITRISLENSITYFDLQSLGRPEDIIISSEPYNAAASYRNIIIVLSRDVNRSKYNIVTMPPFDQGDTFYALDSGGINCFQIYSSLFYHMENNNKSIFLVRAVRNEYGDKASIDITIFELKKINTDIIATPHPTYFEFSLLQKHSEMSEACSKDDVDLLEQKVLKTKFLTAGKIQR